jgi:hypothetical protein
MKLKEPRRSHAAPAPAVHLNPPPHDQAAGARLDIGVRGPAHRCPRRRPRLAPGRSQRCLLARDLGENMEAMARRCAELFVAENGYTDRPATNDSTRWVMEAGDEGPRLRVLADRIGMLDRAATAVQCSVRQCVVFFRARRQPQSCAYRAVTMTQVYTRIRARARQGPRAALRRTPGLMWGRRRPPTSNCGPRRRGPGTAEDPASHRMPARRQRLRGARSKTTG